LVVGAVAGTLALQKRTDLRQACNDGACPPTERENIESYERLGTISGVGFGVALLGTATGVTLLLTDGASKTSREQALAAKKRVTPYVGFGSIGAAGRF
jgi:hypothetical protein